MAKTKAEEVPPGVPRLKPEEYTREIKALLRQVARVSERLARHQEDSAERNRLVQRLVDLGVSVTAQARFVGISPAALYKSKRRAAASGEKDVPGL